MLNDDNDDAEQFAADKENEQHGVRKVRHRRHKRPFYRRVFNYLRTAWTGVSFSSSNGKLNLSQIYANENIRCILLHYLLFL